jgi:D-sedoheptulose 7-phosphate isomerase
MTGYFERLQEVLAGLSQEALGQLLTFVRDCAGTLWICGNGGSASTAQHWACDLSKAAGRRAQALGSNPALLTAWANDVGYGSALAEELRRVACKEDRLICLSCSGTSANITIVLRVAATLGLSRALVTGGKAPADWTLFEMAVTVPSTDYGIIEDCHLAIGHALREQL